MANTYCQIYIHAVFAVKYRGCLLGDSWRQELYRYINGVVQGLGHKLYAIGGMRDHIHILVSMSPTQSVSDMVRDIKRASAMWIKEQHYIDGNFAWQEGYGAFSYSSSQVDKVVRYINHQKQHHIGKTFREEYIDFLKLFKVDYDEHYVFKDVENEDATPMGL